MDAASSGATDPESPGAAPDAAADTPPTLAAVWRNYIAANMLCDEDRRELHEHVARACAAQHVGCIALHDIAERDLQACSSRGRLARHCTACAERAPCYNLGLHVVAHSQTDFIMRWMQGEELEANIGHGVAGGGDEPTGGHAAAPGRGPEGARGGGGWSFSRMLGRRATTRPHLYLYATRSTTPCRPAAPAPPGHRARRRTPSPTKRARPRQLGASAALLVSDDDDDDADADAAAAHVNVNDDVDYDDGAGAVAAAVAVAVAGLGDEPASSVLGRSGEAWLAEAATTSTGRPQTARPTLGARWRDVHVSAHAMTAADKAEVRAQVLARLQLGSVGAMPLRRMRAHELRRCEADADGVGVGACALCTQAAPLFGDMHVVPYTQAHLFIDWLILREGLAVAIEYAPPRSEGGGGGGGGGSDYGGSVSGGDDESEAAPLGDTSVVTNYVLSVRAPLE